MSLGTALLTASILAQRGPRDFSAAEVRLGDTEIKTLYYKDGQRWIKSFPIGRDY
jgi:hypothetical protein